MILRKGGFKRLYTLTFGHPSLQMALAPASTKRCRKFYLLAANRSGGCCCSWIIRLNYRSKTLFLNNFISIIHAVSCIFSYNYIAIHDNYINLVLETCNLVQLRHVRMHVCARVHAVPYYSVLYWVKVFISYELHRGWTYIACF